MCQRDSATYLTLAQSKDESFPIALATFILGHGSTTPLPVMDWLAGRENRMRHGAVTNANGLRKIRIEHFPMHTPDFSLANRAPNPIQTPRFLHN